jgi:hypothetical protein
VSFQCVVARSLDAPLLPVRPREVHRPHLFRREAGAADPVGALRACQRQGIGHHVHHLRVIRQHDVAAVADGARRIRRLALEELGADGEARERLAVGAAELELRARVVELEPRTVFLADRLALAAQLTAVTTRSRTLSGPPESRALVITHARPRSRVSAAGFAERDRGDVGRLDS